MDCNHIIDVSKSTANVGIYIGVWDTLNVESQQFDLSAWVQAYGTGQVIILHQRPGEDMPYEAAGVTVSNGLATWTFDQADTAISGYGSAAVVYIVNGQHKARTQAIRTLIMSTIGDTGDWYPSDPWEDWYTRILEASASAHEDAGEAAASAAAAATSEENAEAWATGGTSGTPSATNNAKYYAEQAASEAADAHNDAVSASGSAADASADASSASANALKSEGYALGKQNGADVSSGSPYYQNNAKFFKEQAASDALQAVNARNASRQWATGGDTGTPSATNNAKYYSEQAADSAESAEAWATGGSGGTASATNNAKYYAEQAADSAATFETDKTLEVSGKAADAKVAGDRINAAFPQETVTGDVITFSDGADGIPMKSLIVDIPVTQTGSGDPAPDNVRPFVGYTGLTVTRAGKNLFNEANATSQSSKAYNLSTGEIENTNNTTAFTSYVPVLPGKAYTISLYKIATTYSMTRVIYYDANKQFISGEGVISSTDTTGYKSGTFTTPQNATYIRFSASAGHRELQIEYGSERTAYEEYAAPLVCPVDWTDEAGTVYGGNIDLVTGLLTVTMANVDMGTLSWGASGGKFRVALPTPSISSTEKGNIVCSAYKTATQAGMPDKSCSSYNGYVWVLDSNYSIYDIPTFKTAMSGVHLVYELATPVTYQLTPQQITSLLGGNTVWADVGAVTATYRADPKMYVDNKIAAVMAVIANL